MLKCAGLRCLLGLGLVPGLSWGCPGGKSRYNSPEPAVASAMRAWCSVRLGAPRCVLSGKGRGRGSSRFKVLWYIFTCLRVQFYFIADLCRVTISLYPRILARIWQESGKGLGGSARVAGWLAALISVMTSFKPCTVISLATSSFSALFRVCFDELPGNLRAFVSSSKLSDYIFRI